MKRNILILLSLIFITGCISIHPKPTREQVEATDCGEFPMNYKDIIKNVFNNYLLDPESARYVFEDITAKFYAGPVNDYGYAFCGTINGKNRYGGYTGASPFFAVIKHGRIIMLMSEVICIPDSYELGQKVALKRIAGTMSYCNIK